ncbi:hypothetical protein [Streptomyces sp. NPDC018610]|uniref:hypothetical protein n=1 Tax=Streptomyces sp. NPDC018610 TaxID=3365049 RepID=UPI0037A9CBF2
MDTALTGDQRAVAVREGRPGAGHEAPLGTGAAPGPTATVPSGRPLTPDLPHRSGSGQAGGAFHWTSRCSYRILNEGADVREGSFS